MKGYILALALIFYFTVEAQLQHKSFHYRKKPERLETTKIFGTSFCDTLNFLSGNNMRKVNDGELDIDAEALWRLPLAEIMGASNFFVNVKDTPYSAKGNGISDDAKAIQAALNAVPSNSIVVFPPGNYKVTKALTIKDSITISGYGATLKNSDTIPFQMLNIEGSSDNHKTDVFIFGLTLDANGTELNINASGIAATFCERIRIEDVTVLNAWGTGILISKSAKDVWIEKCEIDRALGDGIHIGDQYSGEIIQRIWVTNCDIAKSYDGGLAVTAGVHDFWFLNNKIDTTIIGPGIDLSGGFNGLIEGNTTYSYSQIGIRVEAFGGDAYNLKIQKNIVGKPPKGQYCITLLAPNNIENTKPILIKDNFLFGDTTGEGCLFLNGSNYVHVEGNHFEHNLVGIKLDGLAASPNNYTSIINNTFKGISDPVAIGVASVNPNLIKRWNKYVNSPNEDD